MFCRYCGTPSEGPICPACATAQNQAQAAQPTPAPVSQETTVLTPDMMPPFMAPEAPAQPVQPEAPVYTQPEAPVYAQPEAPQYTQPVQPEYAQPVAPAAPQYAQPAYTQPVAPEYPQPAAPQYTQPEHAPVMDLSADPQPPVKKSKKGLWISLVAIVAAVGVAAFALWPTIANLFRSPEQHLRDVTKESLSSYTDTIADLYGTLIKGEPLSDDYNTASAQVSLELNDGLATLLSTALRSEGINLSADKLKSIAIGYDVTMEGDLVQVSANIGLGGSQVLGVTAAVDMETSVAYISVPRLSDQALKLDLKQFGINLATLDLMSLMTMGDATSSGLASAMVALQETLPSEDDFRDMLDSYLDAALEQITLVEETTETVQVGNYYEEQTVLVTNINEVTLLNMGKAMLQVAQNDETLKEMLIAIQNALPYEATGGVDLYSTLQAQLPTLIGQLEAEALKAQASAANALQYKVYVDGDDVLGCKLAVQGMDMFAYNVVEVDGTNYFQLTAPASGSAAPLFSGSYTEDGDTTIGEIVLPADGIEFKIGFETSDTHTSVSFTPPAELIQALIPEAPAALVNGITLKMSVSTDDLAIELPDNTIDASNETQLMTWAYSLMGKLPELLSDLGVSEEIVSDLLGEMF